MANSWEEYYGFKTDPFRGIVQDASGTPIDTRQPTGPHGIGFGPGDLRKARREGWTALSILDYLKGPTGSGGLGTHESSQYFADTGGQAIATPQEVINELRADEALQNRMKTGWESQQALQSNYDNLTNTLTTNYNSLRDQVSTLSSGYDDLSETSQQNTLSISAAQQAAENAMAEAQKVKDPYAITQNSAMQIQSPQTPSSAAGTISAGLAGLSRSGKKFKNKTLNV